VFSQQLTKLTGGFVFTPKQADESVFDEDWLLKCKRKIMAGGGYYNDDYTPNFVSHQFDYDKEYISFIGPCFNLPYAWSGSGSLECRATVSRLIALRAPDRPGFSDYLRYNQARVGRRLRASIHKYKQWFEGRIDRKTFDDEHPEWLFKPNAKRLFRMNVNQQALVDGNMFVDDNKPVGFKPKKGELLEPGKKRGIGDLGAARTNATAAHFSSIKSAMAGVYTHKNYDFEFVEEPSLLKLSSVFEKLVQPGALGKAYYVYFSDDSCVSANCSDGVIYFNGDIKQCDGSHYTAILQLMEEFLTKTNGRENAHYDSVHRAYSYLGKALKFKNPLGKGSVLYKFNELCRRMYSGFAGTTTTNNLANIFIGFSLQLLCPDPGLVTKEEFMRLYVEAAEMVGYLVKVQICETYHDLQFLKHSPAKVDGVMVPYMGVGVMLRGHGLFKGDLPGRGDINKRAQTFVSEVAESRIGWGNHIINRAFQSKIIPKSCKTEMTGVVYANYLSDIRSKSNGFIDVVIPTQEVAARYRVTEAELQSLADLIEQSRIGELVTSRCATMLYNKDYG